MSLAATYTGEYEVLADTSGMDRGEWLAERRRGIGGSDAAAVCGQDRWRSTFEVWLEKTDAPGLDEDRDTEAMAWGRILEPVVADEVARRQNLTVVEERSLLASVLRPWQLANLDRWAIDTDGDVGVYEGKTAGHYAAEDWADDAIPDAYLLQGMHYLAVTGLDWLIYGVLIAGQRLEVRRVQRDQELIDHLITIEAEFWHMVEEKIPPPVDGSKACTELLGHLWDVKPEAVVTLDRRDVEPILVARAEAAAALKTAEEQKSLADNQLKHLIADHEVAIDGDGRQLFTWKQIEQRRLDVDALREQRPEIAEAFTTTSTYRRMHVPKGALR